MDLIDQRHMDALFQIFEEPSATSDQNCRNLQAIASSQLEAAENFFESLTSTIAAHVAEVPSDIFALLSGFPSDFAEETDEEDDGGKGMNKKAPSFDITSIFIGTAAAEQPFEKATAGKKPHHLDFEHESASDPSTPDSGSDIITTSRLQRQLDDSLLWALKNKRE